MTVEKLVTSAFLFGGIFTGIIVGGAVFKEGKSKERTYRFLRQ